MTRQDVFDYVGEEYGTAPDEEIKKLIDISYGLTAPKKRKRMLSDKEQKNDEK